MKHKFNIPNISVSRVTLKGVPFPGALAGKRPEGSFKGEAGEAYELKPEAPGMEEFVRGTRLRGKDRLGRWYFMPVSFIYPTPSGEKKTLELERAEIKAVSAKKNIVETPLVGRKGAVRELISSEDFKVSIRAVARTEDGTYPADQIVAFKELYNVNEAVELKSVLTDLLFDENDKVVITDMSFPETPGVEDEQEVEIECVTDKPFELTIE
jgi:hypothetical protein